MSSPVTFINVFEVPAQSRQVFVDWWRQCTEVLSKEPGFIDARLHQSCDTDARFQFIAVVHWQTAAAFRTAVERHMPVLKNTIPAGKGNPALYQVVTSVVSAHQV